MDEISEYLGREMTAETFEVNTSTHYGRMVRVDDNTVILFGNMDDVIDIHRVRAILGAARRRRAGPQPSDNAEGSNVHDT